MLASSRLGHPVTMKKSVSQAAMLKSDAKKSEYQLSPAKSATKKSEYQLSSFKSGAKKSEYQLSATKSGIKKSEFQLQTDNLTVSKSPSFQRCHLSQQNVRNPSVNILVQGPEDDSPQAISQSLKDLTKDASKDDESSSKDTENGSGGSDITDNVDGTGSGSVMEGQSSKQRSTIEGFHHKIAQTMDQIKNEQSQKEANVNEYLRLAGEADKQQLLRMKQVFEKKNQKSTIVLSTLQKKIDKYNKSILDLQSIGSHKVAKDKLKDMSQNLKDVGTNIVDGITSFSGGMVDNLKGATESFVFKPKEFAHLIKNRFGSAENISSMSKLSDEMTADELTSEGEIKSGAGTLPPSFKFGSEDEKSSVSSGSGFGHHASAISSTFNVTTQQVTIPEATLDMLVQQIQESKENGILLQDKIQQLSLDFETFKVRCQQELSMLCITLDEDKFKIERMEEQMNDINELRQHEMINLRQDISNMEEKIEYRLEERTSDISDLLENCQTRVTKMELQQQQQQVISMEMVDNVRFRSVLSKLLNVILALLAVVLVFVSTFANVLAPFLTNRARILSTAILLTSVILSWKNWIHIHAYISGLLEDIYYFLTSDS